MDGVVYEADCAMIEIGAVNVGGFCRIAYILAFFCDSQGHFLTRGFADTGANASAEEADEDLDDASQKVNNIVHSFRLQATSFDKASYGSYLKGTICIQNMQHV